MGLEELCIEVFDDLQP